MNFTETKVWNEAKELVIKIYEVTKGFPSDEKYGLTRKLQNAATTAPANLAKGLEGNRSDDLEYHFYQAKKNFAEVGSHLKVAEGLGYLAAKKMAELEKDIDDCQKLTYGFIRYQKTKINVNKEKDAATAA